MSTPSVKQPGTNEPRGAAGRWLWAGVCAFVAVGPILLCAVLTLTGNLPPGASPFDEYLTLVGVPYFGAAACCAVFLVRKSRFALWAAITLVLCVSYMLALNAWWWLHDTREAMWVAARFLHLALFGSLLGYIVHLRRQGLLQ
jgi:hypothetical protein